MASLTRTRSAYCPAEHRLVVWLGRLTVAGALLAFFQLAPGRWLSPLFVAKPTDVASELWSWTGAGGDEALLVPAVWVTLRHTLIGLVGGAVLGLILSLAVWRSRTVSAVAEPVLAALNSTPRVTLIPVLVLWMGDGDGPVTLFVLATALFPMFYNALQGWRAADQQMVDMVRILGGRRRHVLRVYLIPAARGYLVSGLLIAAPLTLVAAVVGEMLVGTGLGGLISERRVQFDIVGVYAATVLAAALALVLNMTVSRWGGRVRSATTSVGL